MHRQYYSYKDMPKPVLQNQKDKPENKPVSIEKPKQNTGFLDNFESDDIILAVVILVLLFNDCDDKLLLLALAFIFITGF